MRVFTETQRFNQWWLQLIHIGTLLFLGYTLYKWFIAKEAVDKVGADDATGQLIVVVSIFTVLLLFYFLKLETKIDEIGIYYQFFPFHFSKKIIRWADMKACYLRQYSPLREYGGWGLRYSLGKSGKAYNVRGNKGIQIELKIGKKLLIGTQKEREAQQVIDRYFKQ